MRIPRIRPAKKTDNPMLDHNAVVLRSGRERPVRQRHPWIFSGSIRTIPDDLPDGAIVEITDARGSWLARGYLNRSSQIQVRILTWQQDEIVDSNFWHRRLARSIDLRQRLIEGTTTNAYRLVNGESDYLPGLIVDRYAAYLVLQVGTLGIERIKHQLAQQLLTLTGCEGVLERSDTRTRRLEGLESSNQELAGTAPTAPVEIFESDLRFHVDLNKGQKTGFYIDQRDNRCMVATYCRGKRVLNAFSYSCAFAVHALAQGAAHVTNLDSSFDALSLGEINLRLNGFDSNNQTENVVADVFQIFRDWRDSFTDADRFDVVILDPPKFAHSNRHLDRALRGYKDINLMGLQLLKPGGILATFSCSGLVSADLFQKVVFGAAVDSGRNVQILQRLHHTADHPVSITFPEGNYLKGLICHAL